MALKIVQFDPNWAFPDCNSSLNSPMAMKCCTKLETAKDRCPVVFQGHPSNFKVTRYKTPQILTQIWRFRTIGQSQLSNPSDLPCFLRKVIRDEVIHFWNSVGILLILPIEKVVTWYMELWVNPYCAGTESSWFNFFNIMVADALVPCVPRTFEAMILTM